MENDVLLIPVTEELLPAIVAIENDSFSDPWSEPSLRECSENERMIFLAAARGDDVLGFGLLGVAADDGERAVRGNLNPGRRTDRHLERALPGVRLRVDEHMTPHRIDGVILKRRSRLRLRRQVFLEPVAVGNVVAVGIEWFFGVAGIPDIVIIGISLIGIGNFWTVVVVVRNGVAVHIINDDRFFGIAGIAETIAIGVFLFWIFYESAVVLQVDNRVTVGVFINFFFVFAGVSKTIFIGIFLFRI